MQNNCQDFCVALARYLDPNISAGVFPLCEAGKNENVKDDLGYASAVSGDGMARARAGVVEAHGTAGPVSVKSNM